MILTDPRDAPARPAASLSALTMDHENLTRPAAGPSRSCLQCLMSASWPASYPLVQFPNAAGVYIALYLQRALSP
jgi:hypothetical protein